MKKLFFIISIIALTQILYAQEINSAQKKGINHVEESLLKHYSPTVICLSLLYLDDYSFLFSDTIFKEKMNIMYPDDYFYKLSHEERKMMYFNKLDSCLSSIQQYDIRMEKLNRIESWCNCYNILNYAWISPNVKRGFWEIIFEEIEITAKYLEKYFEDEGQNWTSLSSSEDIMLFFDVVTLISSLPPEEQISFYIEYFEKIINK